MKDFTVLRFLDRIRFLFVTLGIDYTLMRKILQVKLTMDGRRIPTVLNKGSENDRANNFLRSLWIYALMGAITVPFVIMQVNYMFQMSIVFGIYIFMIMSTLISDFSSVLLDVRDKNVLFTRPVDSKTVNAAKMLHVLIYIAYISAAFAGIPAIAALVRHGFLFFMIFVLEIILVDLFIVVLTALMYLLILKFFDGEKLKDIINYVQIALALVIAVGYQLIGRLFSFTGLSVAFVPKWWQCLVVPVWFGAPFEILLRGNGNIYYQTLSALAVAVPVLSITAYIKMIPSFEKNLQKLSSNGGSRRKGRLRLSEKVSRVICFGREERLFFRFASELMKNERDFKLKVYPSLGLSMVFPLIFMMREIGTDHTGLPLNGNYCYNLYFCALLMPTLIIMMKYSSNYNGAWIYKAAPIQDVRMVFKGTLKAFLARLFLPVYLAECVIFLVLMGTGIFMDLIVILLNVLLFTAVCMKVYQPVLPFSESFNSLQNQSWTAIPLMLVLVVLGGLHYFSSSAWFGDAGVYVMIVVSLIANIIMWRKAFDISWEKLKESA